jgi:hypothetical protein
MMEQHQQQQPSYETLAVHQSQLSRRNLKILAEGGYSVMPDQTGWLVFMRPSQGPGGSGQAPEDAEGVGQKNGRPGAAEGRAEDARPVSAPGSAAAAAE